MILVADIPFGLIPDIDALGWLFRGVEVITNFLAQWRVGSHRLVAEIAVASSRKLASGLGGSEARCEVPFIIFFHTFACFCPKDGLMITIDKAYTILLPALINNSLSQETLRTKRRPFLKVILQA